MGSDPDSFPHKMTNSNLEVLCGFGASYIDLEVMGSNIGAFHPFSGIST